VRPTQEDSILLKALEMDRRAEAAGARADAIERELVAAGIINAEPDAAQDYQTYFLPKTPQVALGAPVFALNREEIETYIGCCVDPGFGLILMGAPTDAITRFAREHECTVTASPDFEPDSELDRLLEASGKKGQAITQISCRYQDLAEPDEDAP
jgi:hypothetical protein